MSYSISFEKTMLEPAEAFVDAFTRDSDSNPAELRRLIIEAVAARIGTIDFIDLLEFLEEEPSHHLVASVWKASSGLHDILTKLAIPEPLAIASMLQTAFSSVERKRSGSYMTDFRLTTFLMKRLASRLRPGSRVIDPSVGMGAFLVAFAIEAAHVWKVPVDKLANECLYGSDYSQQSVRGSLCALASVGLNLNTLEKLRKNIVVTDSLLSGPGIWDSHREKFDAIIGNPPWEKLKITRHEYLKHKGVDRYYGGTYESHQQYLIEEEDYNQQKHQIKNYIKTLGDIYSLKGKGEGDLYIFFLELAFNLVKQNNGCMSMLVPAGLIRSVGTESLRRHILKIANNLEITIYNNKQHYFEIDSRFKFLALELQTGNSQNSLFHLNVGSANTTSSYIENTTNIDRITLQSANNELMIIPEVNSVNEWELFKRILLENVRFGSTASIWHPQIVREVDMTRDREHFSKNNGESMLPLIEGRIIHQFNHSAKAYLYGDGRKAVWVSRGKEVDCIFQPQFYYPEKYLPKKIRERVWQERIGFCDISGQTNERTLLAAPIPGGTICGNKVPTITFNNTEEWLPWAFLAYANSFLIDWVLRRISTTSINYFILKELPLPKPEKWLNKLKEIARISEFLACPSHFPTHNKIIRQPSEIAEIRAELEWRILETYQLDASVLTTIFSDFPLLDRSQPTINEENRSTITADLVSLRAMENLGGEIIRNNRLMVLEEIKERVINANQIGAVAFRPSHLSI